MALIILEPGGDAADEIPCPDAELFFERVLLLRGDAAHFFHAVDDDRDHLLRHARVGQVLFRRVRDRHDIGGQNAVQKPVHLFTRKGGELSRRLERAVPRVKAAGHALKPRGDPRGQRGMGVYDIRLQFPDDMPQFSDRAAVPAFVPPVFHPDHGIALGFHKGGEGGALRQGDRHVEALPVEIVQIIDEQTPRAADVRIGQDVQHLNHGSLLSRGPSGFF